MGIFRPNKLGYTSDDVEKKSNSYIMSLVDDFTEKINGIVEKFKSDINGAVVEQNDKLDAKADKATVETHLENTNNPHNVTAAQVGAYLKEEIGNIENLVETYGKETVPDRMVSAILYNKYAIDSLGYDCSQKADKATTLSGYGITDTYTKDETDSLTEDMYANIETRISFEIEKKAEKDLSNVSDEAFLEKLNAVLPDGDEVSY